MAKRKDARVTVILECTSCIRNSDKKVSTGISRYITQKNRHNTPDRLELYQKSYRRYKVQEDGISGGGNVLISLWQILELMFEDTYA